MLCSAEFDWLERGRPLLNIASTPYIAAWVVDDELICMGSIISSRCLVTSAKCILSSHAALRSAGKKNQSFVVVGVTSSSDWTSSSARRYAVDHVVPFPRFTGNDEVGYGRKDIGLLFTSEEIEFSSSVRAVLVPDFDPPPGYNMTVTGYGSSGALVTGRLQHLADDALAYQTYFPDEMFFGPDVVTGGDVCGGVNSAAPAVLSNYLFAIASRSMKIANETHSSCNSPSPRVFTRVPRFSSWITNMQRLFSSAPQGVVGYVIVDDIPLVEPTSSPTRAPTPRRRRRQIRKYYPSKVGIDKLRHSVFVPRGLRSVTFRLVKDDDEDDSTADKSSIPFSLAEFTVSLSPLGKDDALLCVSDHDAVCKLFAPMEGVYHVSIQVKDGEEIHNASGKARLEARFEHLSGYRMVQSVYNGTILPGRKEAFTAIPVVPGPDVTVRLFALTPNTRQRLMLVGENYIPGGSLPLNCPGSLTATFGVPAICRFSAPLNLTSMAVTVIGDSRRAGRYGLEFTYGRFIQTNSRPDSCAAGFPCRAYYSVSSVPLGQVRQFRKAMPPGVEFGVKIDVKSGKSEVRVFIGEDDVASLSKVECFLPMAGSSTTSAMTATYFCSIMTPQSSSHGGDLVDVRVFVKTISRSSSSYTLSMFY